MKRRRSPGQARAARDARLAEHAATTDPGVVLAAATRLIEASPRATADLRRRLERAGYPGSLVEQAISRLTDLGLLDDDAYAQAWIESRDRARPRGARLLRQELLRRGIAPDLAASALEARDEAAALRDADADDEAAQALLERRAASLLREPDPRRRRARAYALLARHGFDPDVAGRAVAAWVESVRDS